MHVHNPGFYRHVARSVRDLQARISAQLHAAKLQRGVTMDRLSRLSGLPICVIDHMELRPRAKPICTTSPPSRSRWGWM